MFAKVDLRRDLQRRTQELFEFRTRNICDLRGYIRYSRSKLLQHLGDPFQVRFQSGIANKRQIYFQPGYATFVFLALLDIENNILAEFNLLRDETFLKLLLNLAFWLFAPYKNLISRRK